MKSCIPGVNGTCAQIEYSQLEEIVVKPPREQLSLNQVLQDHGLQLLREGGWVGHVHEVLHSWREWNLPDARDLSAKEAGNWGAWDDALLLHDLHGGHGKHEEVLRLKLAENQPLSWLEPLRL